MQEKLKILLDKMNLEQDEYSLFEGASLEKIVGNKSKDSYQFIIHMPTNLDAKMFRKLKINLKEAFKEVKKISLVINVDNEDKEKLNDYYREFLNNKLEEFPLLSMSLENSVSKEDKSLVIEIGNKAEQIKLTGIERDFVAHLKQAGYNIEKIEYKVDEEKSKQVQTEIDKIKEHFEVKEVEKTEEIIKGREIKGNITKLADVLYEEPNIVVEVKFLISKKKN